MEIHHLENERIRIRVSDNGAELQSLTDRQSDREWMWQGNPAFWPRTSPVLFPIVGKLANNELRHLGNKYPLPQHGFARDRRFLLNESGDGRLKFLLVSDQDSLKIFPFDFSLEISYQLIENQLKVHYQVENPGEVDLPFSIGAHPGFSLHGWPSRKFILEFEKEEILQCISLKEGLLDFSKINSIQLENRQLEITDSLFERDALVIRKADAGWIAVKSPEDAAELRLHSDHFPWLGIWSKPGAPFVCIEPWYGHADPLGFTEDFPKKPGIIVLPPGRRFGCSFRIELLA